MKGSTPEERRAAVARAIRSGGEALARYGVDISNLALSGGPDEAAKKVVWDAVNPIPAIEAARNTLAQAKRSGGADDWKMATIAALGVPGAATPLGRKGPKKPRGGAGGGRGDGPPPPTTTEGGILSVPDLRTMTNEEAIAQARTEQHLIPKKGGGYVGAPRTIKDRAGLEAMRAKMDADVAAGQAGGDWYDRAQAMVVELAGPDPARQHLLARELGLWSPQSDPDPNLNFAIAAHNAYEMGQPLEQARTGAQARVYREARDAGAGRPTIPMMGHNGGPPLDQVSIPLGRKTGPYADGLDPTRTSITGANDLWHARTMGYTKADGSIADGTVTPQEHRFMDYETLAAAGRANDINLHGRSDWTGPQVQAAPWVVNKAKGLMERFGWSEEKALAEANKTYADHLDKYTAFGTYEPIPYVKSRHLPDMVTADPDVKMDFANDPRSSWADGNGRDIVYDALGAYQRPTQRAMGVYTPPGGLPENNPAFVARPMVAVKDGAMYPADREMMEAAEAFRAYFDVQGAGAGHKPIFNAKPAEMGSVFTPNDGPMTVRQIEQLQALGREFGLGDVVDTGQGATQTLFYPGDPPGGSVTKRNLTKGGLGAGIEDILGSGSRQMKVDGVYQGYEDAWEAADNSGQATNQLFDYVGEAARHRLDTPDLRRHISALADRDDEIARATGQPIRQDAQRARRAYGSGGWDALDRLKRAGLAPALLLPLLGIAGLSSLPQEEEPGV
jgi:hypothetical protein